MKGNLRGVAASAVVVFLASAGALFATGAMKLVAAAAPLPKDTKPTALSGLTSLPLRRPSSGSVIVVGV